MLGDKNTTYLCSEIISTLTIRKILHIQLKKILNHEIWTIMWPTFCFLVSFYYNHGCMDRKATKFQILLFDGLVDCFSKMDWFFEEQSKTYGNIPNLNSVAFGGRYLLPVSSIIWRRIDTFATPSLPVHKETRLFEAEVKLLRFKWPHFLDPVLFCTGGEA